MDAPVAETPVPICLARSPRSASDPRTCSLQHVISLHLCWGKGHGWFHINFVAHWGRSTTRARSRMPAEQLRDILLPGTRSIRAASKHRQDHFRRNYHQACTRTTRTNIASLYKSRQTTQGTQDRLSPQNLASGPKNEWDMTSAEKKSARVPITTHKKSVDLPR